MAGLIADPFRAARLILQLRRQGIRDDAVLSAMETVNRAAFVSASLASLAETDTALPIDCGQTMPRPIVVAQLLGALRASRGKEDRVLLVGAGSGYVAALLAQISRHVWAVDRYSRLADGTAKRLKALKVENVSLRQGDGLAGWREHAPYDRILLAGAVTDISDVLIRQLERSGALVAAVETGAGKQVIRRVEKSGATSDSAIAETLPLLKPGLAAAL